MAALRWTAESHADDPAAMAEVLSESLLIEEWGGRDPTAAFEAVSGLPTEVAAPFVGDLVREWADQEPSRASEFIVEQFPDDGIVRDQAVAGLVERISATSPAEAQAWAESISDESLRASVLQSLGEEDR